MRRLGLFLLILLLVACSPEDSGTKLSKDFKEDYVKEDTVIQCGKYILLHFYKDGFFFGEHKVRFINQLPNFTSDTSYWVDLNFIYVEDIVINKLDETGKPDWVNFHFVLKIERDNLNYYSKEWVRMPRWKWSEVLGTCILRDIDFFEKTMDRAEKHYDKLIDLRKRIKSGNQI